MLYFFFILLLIAVLFAVVWLGGRAKKSATGEPDKLADSDES